MSRRRGIAWLACVTSLLWGCAAAPPSPVPDQGVARVCFARGLNGFSLTPAGALRVESRWRQVYEIRFRGVCPELRHAVSLALIGHGSCLAPGDRILPLPPSGGNPPPRACLIQRIDAVQRGS